MAQRNSTCYSSQWEDSKPRAPRNDSYRNWQSQPLAGQNMTRNGSNDSAYCSAVSQHSDEVFFSNPSPIAAMSAGGSPTFQPDNFSTPQYLQSQYFESSSPLERSNSDRSTSSRATPSSLGWIDNNLLKVYKFVVQKGKEPYFELLPGCYVTTDTPARVYLDNPKNPQKNMFPCQYPSCEEKIFKRPADLERHYRNVHASLDQKDQYPCDYQPCQKIREPFTRKDHFRDHLRDYHKEDLGCAKGEKLYEKKKWAKLQDAWIAERKIVGNWWRCPKCLHRVQIAEFGWKCPDCKHPCDRERADRIEVVRAKATSAPPMSAGMDDGQYDTAATTKYPSNCTACGDTAWIWNEHGGNWDACQSCQPLLEQSFYPVDDDLRYETSRY